MARTKQRARKQVGRRMATAQATAETSNLALPETNAVDAELRAMLLPNGHRSRCRVRNGQIVLNPLPIRTQTKSNPEVISLSDDGSPKAASPIVVNDDESIIWITDDEKEHEEDEKKNTKKTESGNPFLGYANIHPDRKPLLSANGDEGQGKEAKVLGAKPLLDKEDVAPAPKPLFNPENLGLGFIPPHHGARRALERKLAQRKYYGPVWLAKSGVRDANLHRAALKSKPGAWLADCYLNPRVAEDQPRIKDMDGLPRWFGPLNLTIVHFNHGKVPENSFQFFHLLFQPVEPGDMEVWVKYRTIEEELWVNQWERHARFKQFMTDLHSIAFGQKAEARTKVEQMNLAVRTLWKDVEGRPDGAKEGEARDYFILATAKAKATSKWNAANAAWER